MRLIKLIGLLTFGFGILGANVKGDTFTATGALNTAREAQTTTRLDNGQILVVGGCNSSGSPTATAELYSPATGTFAYTGSLNFARGMHTATLLQDGTVLITGGLSSGCSALAASTATAELYNPSTGTFSVVGSLQYARYHHSETLLTNGDVLIAGGTSTCPLFVCTVIAKAEIYTPSSETFAATGSMHYARSFHTATLLNSGSVLVAGGAENGSGTNSSAELFSTSTGTFAVTGSLNTARSSQVATLLANGKVLVAGGIKGSTYLSSAELYDPTAGTFSATGNMTTARSDACATLLSDALVLVAGGSSSGSTFLSSAELYNPTTGTFAADASMLTTRQGREITSLLSSGAVLVAGGINASGVLADAELYNGPFVGYVDPKFVVVGVTYAPPDPSSNTFVTYGNSTFIGTTNSVMNSFTSGKTFTVSLTRGFKIGKVLSGSVKDTYSTTSSQTTKNTSSVTVSFQTSTSEKTFGTGSYWTPVNNDYDTVWVWLNPVLIFSTSGNIVTSNGYGLDELDEAAMDIVGIQLGYLNGHFGSMPPDIQTSINRTWAAGQIWGSGQGPALTSADLAQIAAADPFSVATYGSTEIGFSPPSPETPDSRFTMSTCTAQSSFDYVQAAPSQVPAIFTCTLAYTNMSTQAQDISSTYSQTYSVDVSFTGSEFLSNFSSDVTSASTLSWTIDSNSSVTTSNTSTASLSDQGPPCNNVVQGQGPCVPVYDSGGNQPTQFFVYQDNMFGTFMFAPLHFY